jgi:hypothetical protein
MNRALAARTAAMKEIVLVTVAFDWETGEIVPGAPFMVNSSRLGTLYNRPYENEPEVIAQFQPGEWQARFEAEWNDETGNWIFGRRVADA